MQHNLLFVYGTLLDQDNKTAIYLRANSSFYQEGSFKGILYHLGTYPAAVYNAAENNIVHGKIYQLFQPEIVLKTLDDYEGIAENDEQPYEYRRELLAVDTARGQVQCWVYLYNLPTQNLGPIPSGRWIG